ncbi:hypothetical protein BZG42_02410 [Streptococcus sp. DAT741]|nr:hypothetical protein BZG42_02410 [Streptococcus sp. DAT741]
MLTILIPLSILILLPEQIEKSVSLCNRHRETLALRSLVKNYEKAKGYASFFDNVMTLFDKLFIRREEKDGD